MKRLMQALMALMSGRVRPMDEDYDWEAEMRSVDPYRPTLKPEQGARLVC